MICSSSLRLSFFVVPIDSLTSLLSPSTISNTLKVNLLQFRISSQSSVEIVHQPETLSEIPTERMAEVIVDTDMMQSGNESCRGPRYILMQCITTCVDQKEY